MLLSVSQEVRRKTRQSKGGSVTERDDRIPVIVVAAVKKRSVKGHQTDASKRCGLIPILFHIARMGWLQGEEQEFTKHEWHMISAIIFLRNDLHTPQRCTPCIETATRMSHRLYTWLPLKVIPFSFIEGVSMLLLISVHGQSLHGHHRYVDGWQLRHAALWSYFASTGGIPRHIIDADSISLVFSLKINTYNFCKASFDIFYWNKHCIPIRFYPIVLVSGAHDLVG